MVKWRAALASSEMLKASGDIGVNLITKLINAIIRETSVPDDWLKSVVVNGDKGKDDVGNVLVVHGEMRNALRSYYEHLLNEELPWNRDILEAVEPVQGPPPEIKNEWVKKAIDEMKNGKVASSTVLLQRC